MNRRTPANDPITLQNGSSRPAKIGAREKLIAIGVAPTNRPSIGVRSAKGIGRIVTFLSAKVSVKAGIPT